MEASKHSFKNIPICEDHSPSQQLGIPIERTRHPSSVSFDLAEFSESEKDNLSRIGLGNPSSRSLRSQSVLSRMSVNSQEFGLIKGGIGAGILTVAIFVLFVICYNWWNNSNMK